MTAAARGPVLVVGGGLSGHHLVTTLRSAGVDAPITFLTGEPWLPYDRPPLSKEGLITPPARPPLLADQEWYRNLGVDIVRGVRATGIDVERRFVTGDNHRKYAYGTVIIATGARARSVTWKANPTGVNQLRTWDDSRRIAEALRRQGELLIVGGGFIGLEVAASARTLSKAVTVVEMQQCLLGRLLGEAAGSWLRSRHEREGTRFRLGSQVVALSGEPESYRARFSDGHELDVADVLVGVGSEPDDQWLAGSGVVSAGGIRCDMEGWTGIPGVYAVGDVAAWWDPRLQRHHRSEHWSSAVQQAQRVAGAIGDQPMNPGTDIPWFWSDQFNDRIRFFGWAGHYDQIEVSHPRDGALLCAYHLGGDPTGVLSINAPKEAMQLRRQLCA